MVYVFFFKQKTAYEMRISDWSSDVCSSDLYQDHQMGVRGRECSTRPAKAEADTTEKGFKPWSHLLSSAPSTAAISSRKMPASSIELKRPVRSEESRVGKESVSTCRSRWSPHHEKKNRSKTPQTLVHN